MGDYIISSVLICLACVAMVFSRIGGGFLFAEKLEDYSIVINAAYFFIIIGLFITGNFFITSIRDGKGSLRLIYCSTAYSLLPMIIVLPILTVLCRGLTYNESILVELVNNLVYLWCGVSIVVMLKEAHDYSFMQMLASMLLTVFFMLVVIIFASLMFLLVRQLWNFIQQFLLEVRLNV